MISQRESPQSFESLHWMGYRLPGDRVALDLTGIVLTNLKGGSAWERRTLQVQIEVGRAIGLLNLPAPQPGYYWQLRPAMWSASAAPAAIENLGRAVNAGWAVDRCYTGWDVGTGTPLGTGAPILLYLDTAVRDTDGVLWRISYDIRVVCDLRQQPVPVIG